MKLSAKWTKYLLALPESGMGYQKVDIVLSNGQIINDVIVHNAEEIELPEAFNDMKESEIYKIKLRIK